MCRADLLTGADLNADEEEEESRDSLADDSAAEHDVSSTADELALGEDQRSDGGDEEEVGNAAKQLQTEGDNLKLLPTEDRCETLVKIASLTTALFVSLLAYLIAVNGLVHLWSMHVCCYSYARDTQSSCSSVFFGPCMPATSALTTTDVAVCEDGTKPAATVLGIP